MTIKMRWLVVAAASSLLAACGDDGRSLPPQADEGIQWPDVRQPNPFADLTPPWPGWDQGTLPPDSGTQPPVDGPLPPGDGPVTPPDQGSTASSYQVVLENANYLFDYNGCDMYLGPCDMYLKLKVGSQGKLFQSSTIWNNHNPVWNETLGVVTVTEALAGFDGEMIDENAGILPDISIGQCCPKKLTQSDLASGSIKLTCRYTDTQCNLVGDPACEVFLKLNPI